MSIEKALNFNDGYGNYETGASPTTYSDMHKFMKNQNNVLLALAAIIWQPSTAYAVGDIVLAPSMNGHYARCTVAGTSGTSVPTWPADSNVNDGEVTWVVEKYGTGSGSSVTIDSALSSTSTNPVQNKVINSAVSAKANTDSPTFKGTVTTPTLTVTTTLNIPGGKIWIA